MGHAGWFRTFCNHIKVGNRDKISKRYKAITRRLNKGFWTTQSQGSHSLLVGSYGRHTAIDSTSDVDMIFQLPHSTYTQFNGYRGNGQSALLQSVRAALKETYSRTGIGADGQVIQIFFSDGITFELLPAFLNSDGSYKFPDSNQGGKWKTTNPRPEIQAIGQRNNECNKNLIRLCQMMRSWKKTLDVPISGLLIDTLAYQFIINWKHRSKSFKFYDCMCSDFFRFMVDQRHAQKYWRAPGSGQYVYRKGKFEHKAKCSHTIALAAIEHYKENRAWSAKRKWQEVFGTSFLG